MTGSLPASLVASVLALSAALAGCSSDDPAPVDPDRVILQPLADGEGHTHAPGQDHGAAPVGDGIASEAGGYRMTAVELPEVGRPGEMSFRLEDTAGEVLTEYVEEQTKDLHLYVVRGDLSSFRHLHPTLDDDGTWRAQVDLEDPGPWRVVAEFTPGGTSQAIVLGSTIDIDGDWEPVEIPRGDDARAGDDGVVRIQLLAPGRVSDNGRLELLVTDLAGEPLTLGSYLGASAHLTGFSFDSGSSGGFVHVHPYGAPEVTDEGTRLTFHTSFSNPGTYRMFVQVRVEGLLHQVAVTAPVTE